MSYFRKQGDKKKISRIMNNFKHRPPCAFGSYYYNDEKQRVVRYGSTLGYRRWKRKYNRKIRRNLNRKLNTIDIDNYEDYASEGDLPNIKNSSNTWDIT